MPELPEVEYVARSLHKLLCGRKIVTAALLRERLAPDITPRSFARCLAGASVLKVHRRGKHILFELDNRLTLIVHLRMSGRFLIHAPGNEGPKFVHAIFELDGGQRLLFQDQRHFGLMKIVRSSRLAETRELKKLAPEPFSEDFSSVYLYASLRRSRRAIKEFLIDQTRVCGLGNIYASEALFRARIHPAKRSYTLSGPRTATLHEMIVRTLAEAIEDITSAGADAEDGELGRYGNQPGPGWLVYERKDEPCKVCGTPIRRLRQGGRSTYFCPVCQRR